MNKNYYRHSYYEILEEEEEEERFGTDLLMVKFLKWFVYDFLIRL
jgi:hypothetical protein